MTMSITDKQQKVKLDIETVIDKLTQNIPDNLKTYPHFCLWGRRLEDGGLAVGKDGKIDKAPINPHTGKKDGPDNPANFAPFQDTLQALRGSRCAGMGVGLFPLANSPYLLGAIDIDHCVDADGKLSEMAQDILQTMAGTYAEISPSGTGIRVLFTVKADFYHGDVDGYKETYRIMGEKQPDGQKLEIYIAGFTSKYLTVTGNTLTPGALVVDCGKQILEVLDRYMRRPADKPTLPVPVPVPAAAGIPADDNELLKLAFMAANGSKFRGLWEGDTGGHNGDDSAADQALCNLLAFWTGGDADRMDRLFRRSGLMREKWDRVHDGKRTYGQMTIDKAIADASGFYSPKRQQAPTRMQAQIQTQTQMQMQMRGQWQPDDYTDTGNAYVFMEKYRDEVCYVDALGWLAWDGSCWRRDRHGVYNMATYMALSMTDEAKEQYTKWKQTFAAAKKSGDTETAERAEKQAAVAAAYLKHALKTQGKRQQDAALAITSHFLAVKADTLDSGACDLNTPAGIVDLRTGAIRDHDREAYCTHITTVAPGTTGAKDWEAFLSDITRGDTELQNYLQTVAGMILYGQIYHEGIVLLNGGGSNGKTTFVNCLMGVIGTGETGYAGKLSASVITGRHKGNELVQYESIRGKRMVSISELEVKDRLSVSVLKTLASRDNVMKIERKYQDTEEVKPVHTILLDTNNLPRIDETDEGTWRRITVVPFNAHFSETDGTVKTNLSDTLTRDAGPAILQWMIDGAVKFAAAGCQIKTLPNAVLEATGKYRHGEDSVAVFVEECCRQEPGGRTGARELYERYKQWMMDRGEKTHILNERGFSQRLTAMGFRQVKPGNKKTWLDLSMGDAPERGGYVHTDADAPVQTHNQGNYRGFSDMAVDMMR